MPVRDQHEIVSFEVEPGDVIAFHYRTLHTAPGTAGRTSSRRRAVSFRYLGSDARFATQAVAALTAVRPDHARRTARRRTLSAAAPDRLRSSAGAVPRTTSTSTGLPSRVNDTAAVSPGARSRIVAINPACPLIA